MYFSLTSLLTSLLFGTLILIVQRFLLRMTNHKNFINSKILTIFNFLFIFRLLFPFEFGYTLTMRSKVILPKVKDFLNFHIITVYNYEITVFRLLLTIWLVGSLIKLYSLIRDYLKIKQLVRMTPDYQVEYYEQASSGYSVKVVESLDSPVVIGLRHPVVLLPKIEFSKKELNYVLTHEALHISNFDLFVKYFYELIIVIYWWNPLMYLFRDQMDNVIELKTDEQLIATLTYDERLEYAQTLVKVRENQMKKRDFGSFAVSFSYGTNNQLLFRTKYILEENRRKYSWPTLLSVGILGIFLSTSIIFEPSRIKEEHIGQSFAVSEDTNYLVELPDNQYELYMDGQFLIVITQEQLERNEDFQKLPIYSEDERPEIVK